KEAPEAQMQGSLLPRLECSGTITAASISQAQENSWKPRLPPHAHCLTRATLHSGELLGLLSVPPRGELIAKAKQVETLDPRALRV
ncbi:RNF135 isoform 7, partial [Pan troglodytes]